jgi:hypothetical protein
MMSPTLKWSSTPPPSVRGNGRRELVCEAKDVAQQRLLGTQTVKWITADLVPQSQWQDTKSDGRSFENRTITPGDRDDRDDSCPSEIGEMESARTLFNKGTYC